MGERRRGEPNDTLGGFNGNQTQITNVLKWADPKLFTRICTTGRISAYKGYKRIFLKLERINVSLGSECQLASQLPWREKMDSDKT